MLYVESGSDVTIGPLFQLRHTYPIIDGVGYATLPHQTDDHQETHVSLIFFQTSLSKYYDHEKKLHHLLEHKSPENNKYTILDYFKNKASNNIIINKILYVYVSPHKCKEIHLQEKKSRRSTVC